jgi:site-specific recombinase XerD
MWRVPIHMTDRFFAIFASERLYLAKKSPFARLGPTIRAYQTDIQQFLSYLHETNVSIQTPADVEKVDIVEYLSSLAKRELKQLP